LNGQSRTAEWGGLIDALIVMEHPARGATANRIQVI
jgi:hypothetical protein